MVHSEYRRTLLVYLQCQDSHYNDWYTYCFQDILGVVDLKDGQLRFFDKASGDIRGKSIESKTYTFYGVGIYSAETQPQQLSELFLTLFPHTTIL